MFIFGHVGIGRKLASPWSRRLPPIPLVVGCLLPDLMDKSIFYGLRGLHSVSSPGGMIDSFTSSGLDFFDGTRTLGHTAIFLFIVLAAAGLTKSRVLSAVALGMATHLLLDNASDRLHDLFNHESRDIHQHSAAVAMMWPLLGKFLPFSYTSMADHLGHAFQPETLIGEVLGLLFLGWDYWKNENRKELRQILFSRRYRRMRKYRTERD